MRNAASGMQNGEGVGSSLEMLRFTTAGSVDDGKSTLIGRLLFDSKTVFEDQLESLAKTALRKGTHGIDLSLITDGLAAEREQGITIDVAYRYFSTPKRKFIIADTPGHEQYTRNMVTGASTANLAVVLTDARKGVLPQSKRHGFIASLLGIPHIVLAVNKMDLVDYARDVYEKIKADFGAYARDFKTHDITFIPVSALTGDNIVTRSVQMPWYTGPTLLEFLENVPIRNDRNLTDFRFPVQLVVRPHQDFRGYAGDVASGTIAPGDTVMALPSRRQTRVRELLTYNGKLDRATVGQSVVIVLADEVDLSRGDMLVKPDQVPNITQDLKATLCWMADEPLEPGKRYLVKHTTQMVGAMVQSLDYRVDIHTLAHEPAQALRLNEIGAVTLKVKRPLYVDAYDRNRLTGAFVLIDELSNNTVGAGMVV